MFNKKTQESLRVFIGAVLIAVFLLLPFGNVAKGLISVIDGTAVTQRNFHESLLQKYQITTPTPHFWSDVGFKISQIAHNVQEHLKEWVLDPLFWTMANVVIDQFGDAIVNWIRNGFEGSPMFLSDPEGFFRDTANQVSGAIIDDLNIEWLCDPLGKLRIDLNFFFPGTDRAKYRCTFNDIAGSFKNIPGRKDLSDWVDFNVNIRQQNIIRLYGSDYRHGGFLMWLTTAQKKNNDIGRTIEAANSAYTAAGWSVGTQRFQLANSGGFFGMKKCVAWSDGREKGGPRIEDKNAKCVKEVETTPGELVQDQLNRAVGSDLDRLHVADEINEIIGALASTMVGWMLTGGNGGGGVLAYDKNADYSASNRDHYGIMENSQNFVDGKTNIAADTESEIEWENMYAGVVKREWGSLSNSLLGTKSNLETIKSKLECIESVNKDNEEEAKKICGSYYEEFWDVVLDSGQKNTIDNDIASIDREVAAIQEKHNKYNNVVVYSGLATELLKTLQEKATRALSLDEMEKLKEEYCYEHYSNGSATICGNGGNFSVSNAPSVHISADINPISVFGFGEGSTTTAKIYWYSSNADACVPSDGSGDTNWLNEKTDKEGFYKTTVFESGETRSYSISCSNENTKTEESVFVQKNDVSSTTPSAIVKFFAEPSSVKLGEKTTLYWLSTNIKDDQCYLYSPSDPLNGGKYYSKSNAKNNWWNMGEGYYLKTNSNNTAGKGTFNIATNTDYSISCQGFSGKGTIASLKIKIDSLGVNNVVIKYTTHNESQAKMIDSEIDAVIADMNAKINKYNAMLADYIKTRKSTLYYSGGY